MSRDSVEWNEVADNIEEYDDVSRVATNSPGTKVGEPMRGPLGGEPRSVEPAQRTSRNTETGSLRKRSSYQGPWNTY